MSKKANDALRAKYIEVLTELLGASEDVLRTNTGEVAFPVVDNEGEDSWVVVTVKIPSGSRDGEPYDGYSVAEDFKMKQATKAEKAAAQAAAKAKKIARDQKMREAKAAAKAAAMAKKEA